MTALKIYLPVALVLGLIATTGADVLAQINVAGESFTTALQENLHYAGAEFIGTIVLLAPFVMIAVICGYAEKYAKARARRIRAVFVIAMLPLLYFYFEGHFAAQQAMKGEHWTAAALSIGMLPFVIGAPAVLLTFCAAAFAAGFDRETPD